MTRPNQAFESCRKSKADKNTSCTFYCDERKIQQCTCTENLKDPNNLFAITDRNVLNNQIKPTQNFNDSTNIENCLENNQQFDSQYLKCYYNFRSGFQSETTSKPVVVVMYCLKSNTTASFTQKVNDQPKIFFSTIFGKPKLHIQPSSTKASLTTTLSTTVSTTTLPTEMPTTVSTTEIATTEESTTLKATASPTKNPITTRATTFLTSTQATTPEIPTTFLTKEQTTNKTTKIPETTIVIETTSNSTNDLETSTNPISTPDKMSKPSVLVTTTAKPGQSTTDNISSYSTVDVHTTQQSSTQVVSTEQTTQISQNTLDNQSTINSITTEESTILKATNSPITNPITTLATTFPTSTEVTALENSTNLQTTGETTNKNTEISKTTPSQKTSQNSTAFDSTIACDINKIDDCAKAKLNTFCFSPNTFQYCQ